MNQRISATKGADWISILLYLALVGFGWLNIFATSVNLDAPDFFNPDSEHFKQLVWIVVSLLAFGAVFLIDSKFFIEFSYVFYGIATLLLVLVIFFGIEVNAAKAWFEFGFMRFQPVELAKVASALTFARFISRFQFSFNKIEDYVKLGLLWILPVAIVILQNDTGSALVFFAFIIAFFREGMTPYILAFGFIMAGVVILALVVPVIFIILFLVVALFCAIIVQKNLKEGLITLAVASVCCGVLLLLLPGTNGNPNYNQAVIISMLVATIVMVVIVLLKRIPKIGIYLLMFWGAVVFTYSANYFFDEVLSEYQRSRVLVVMGLKEDPLGAGFNVNQSKIAIGSGGLTGTGFLQGTQTRFNFVPKQSTDFIFSTVGEEWGFIGTSMVVVAFFALLYRLIVLAERQRSTFCRVYGYSVASIIFFHVTINIGMTIGLVPVIGIPLPFISYGGSSLLGFTILLAIFLKLDTNRTQILR